MENQKTQAVYGAKQEKISGMHLPQCPHCGKKLNPFFAWGIKSKGEFACGECGTFSNIRLTKGLHIMGWLSAAIAAVLLLIFLFTGCMNLPLLICMLIPFFVFTVISPFFVRLEPIGMPGKKKQGAKQSPSSAKGQTGRQGK